MAAHSGNPEDHSSTTPAGGLSAAIAHALHHAHHILPAQNPLERFVHHNTLHAFEELPFEQGLEAAAAVYGTEPAIPETVLRDALQNGRISPKAIRSEIQARFPTHLLNAELSPGITQEIALQRLLQRPPPLLSGQSLAWLLEEGGLLETWPADLSAEPLSKLKAQGEPKRVLPRLYERILAWTAAHPGRPVRAARVRPRDRLEAAGAPDPDDKVLPMLVRWCGAWLDTGHAEWGMADRGQVGFLHGLIAHILANPIEPRPYFRGLPAAARAAATTSADDLIITHLEALGLAGAAAEDHLLDRLLSLRGWAGMFARLEERPDLVPTPIGRVALRDLLAMRLLLDQLALNWALDEANVPPGPLAQRIESLPFPAANPGEADPAWLMFHHALGVGIGPEEADDATLTRLFHLVSELPNARRRALLGAAYERTYRDQILDGLAVHWRRAGPRPRAQIQVVACIDDREESFRRHLEEQDPEIETFGAAGFFGIPMYYRSKVVGTGQGFPLCPAPVTPRHLVEEVPESTGTATRRRGIEAALHRLSQTGGSLAQGSLISLGGWLTLFPLATQLLAPRLHAKVQRSESRIPTELRLLRPAPGPDGREPTSPEGLLIGFSLDEMAEMVGKMLEDIGLTSGFSPIVLFLGHGSHSANNPHRAAYECGACGGGQGGPNARAFANMANRAEVRERIRNSHRNIHIPDGTVFLGGLHDTADDTVVLYDLHHLPTDHAPHLARLQQRIDEARRRNAHERCRRFVSADLDLSPDEALAHVEGRAEDLAQPRPELGHATNAVCVVGRRQITRGLFLDRRSFLQSYDPTIDPDGRILERILAAVGPVGAGINLEYYFSFIDPSRYGCGTKLPHNVMGHIAVMDGAGSDLRTGLPWQMVEIHEPMRLLLIVETTPERLGAVVARLPAVARLATNGWVQVACVDPDTGEVHVLDGGVWKVHPLPERPIPTVQRSREWYQGHRGHLSPATLSAGLSAGAPELRTAELLGPRPQRAGRPPSAQGATPGSHP
jgi:uncharacterized protein YbcC (UPF0753/DUF2309 family)